MNVLLLRPTLGPKQSDAAMEISIPLGPAKGRRAVLLGARPGVPVVVSGIKYRGPPFQLPFSCPFLLSLLPLLPATPSLSCNVFSLVSQIPRYWSLSLLPLLSLLL